MKYRIVEYQEILKDKKTNEIIETKKPCYIIEGKSLLTILLSPKNWEQITPFVYYDLEEALKDFTELVSEKNVKTCVTKKILYEA